MSFSKIIVIIVFTLLTFNFVNAAAEVNLEASLKWINKTAIDRNWELSIDELTYSILALSANNYNVQKGIEELKSRKSGDGSFGNKVYDTSLAIITLNENKEDVSSSVNWLLQQQIKAQSQGSWLIEIKTEQSGSCSVSLSDTDPVSFNIEENRVSCDSDGDGDGFGSWIDLERCAGFNLDRTEEVLVNCNNLGNADIYLIYNLDNDYYLIDEKFNTNQARLLLENAYFGDYESTAYASLALKMIGKSDNIYSLSYLRSNLRQNDILQRTFLYILTGDKVYSDWLSRKQNNLTGSWDGNVFNTAFSVMALGKNSAVGSKGAEWLRGEQNVNNGTSRYGSWNNDLRDTSFVIWSVFSEGSRVIIPNDNNYTSNYTNNNYTSGVCGNYIRDPDEDCDARYASNGDFIEGDDIRCGLSEKCVKPGEQGECTCRGLGPITEEPCQSDEECTSSRQYCDQDTQTCKDKECTSDEDCDTPNEVCNLRTFECEIETNGGEECTEECEEGFRCIDKECVEIPNYCTDNENCDKGEECDISINRCVPKEGKFPWWIITILVLAIAGIVILYALKKRSNKPKAAPANVFERGERPQMRPSFSTQQSRQEPVQRRDIYDERIESELDKSIRRAKELLGKK